jgi:putative two-component system response regulator
MARILVVDDEQPIRELLCRLLDHDGHESSTAADVPHAREQLALEDFEVVLCDVNLPGESGLVFVEDALAAQSDIAVVMVTGSDDPELAEKALELGAYGYVVKPFRPTELSIAVANALRRRRLEIENRHHRERLEETVADKTAALREAVAGLERSERELQASREETIHRLARAAEFRDNDTGNHIERVSHVCGLLARHLGLDGDRCELLRIASPLHDIGKIAVPDRVLLKPGSLSPDERAQMERHAEAGYWMLSGSGQPLLDLAALVAWTHHEQWDGGGYPRGLAGEEIPIEGRIVAVADVFDALTSDRVYRPALTPEEALRIMREGRGTHFDPVVLDAFLELLPAVLAQHPIAPRSAAPHRAALLETA